MLHEINGKLGKIRFRMIECQYYLTDCILIDEDDDTGYEVHTEGDVTTIIDRVPTGDLSSHLTAIRHMVEESVEEKEAMREALSEIVYAIITDPDYKYAMGEMGQLLFKHREVLTRNDISFE
jgi:hypothetical protein